MKNKEYKRFKLQKQVSKNTLISTVEAGGLVSQDGLQTHVFGGCLDGFEENYNFIDAHENASWKQLKKFAISQHKLIVKLATYLEKKNNETPPSW